MLRVVLDTNTVISGLLWTGAPMHALDAGFELRVIMLSTPDVVWEYRRTLIRPKFKPYFERLRKTPDQFLSKFEQLAEVVIPAFVPEGVIRDPKDRHILACAVGGNADAIISGDKDLTDLKRYAGIPIWSAPYFLQQLDLLSSRASE